MSKIKSRLREFLRFFGYLSSRFSDDACLVTAAALSFATILSLVPLMAVMLAVLSAFPAFDHLMDRVQNFVFLNLMPASGEVIQGYIQQFVNQASDLSGIGIVFLILTALFLMNTIDTALNRIWRAHRNRRLISKFLIYWSVLTLGPILLAVSMVMTSYVVSLPFFVESTAIDSMKSALFTWMPLMATTLALTMLYIIVPNLNVPLYTGLTGGVTAALLFEIAKKGFAIYVTSVPTYATLYGALAVIPIFLVWIYILWIIVLLGAEISSCLATFGEYRDKLAGEGSR